MRPVAVRILHPAAADDAGPLTRRLTAARADLAERHRAGFVAAGADDVRIVAGPPDDTPFGRRLRDLVDADRPPGGLVVLGSGAVPLATRRDRQAFVLAAGADDRRALANNRYSADIVAVSCAREGLRGLPDLPGDNALPRWLEEAAGYAVTDMRRRWRLAIDLDSPLDLVLTGGGDPVDDRLVIERIDLIRRTVADRDAEMLIAGRTSAATLAWLERRTASRTRALVEERGLRTTRPGQRAPASVLGAVLDVDGPGALGRVLARFADAAVIDSRVLLAHRLGADERAWPSAEDRFASDLLLADRVGDPWLRDLTAAAADATIPILLGGHTLVGPGARLVIGG